MAYPELFKVRGGGGYPYFPGYRLKKKFKK